MSEEDCKFLGQKPIRRADLICKIFDGVEQWTNGCYKCKFDQSFLLMLAMMDDDDLQRYLDEERYKTAFKKHEKRTQIHDLNIF